MVALEVRKHGSISFGRETFEGHCPLYNDTVDEAHGKGDLRVELWLPSSVLEARVNKHPLKKPETPLNA